MRRAGVEIPYKWLSKWCLILLIAGMLLALVGLAESQLSINGVGVWEYFSY